MSVCLSICPSVTCWYCVKKAQPIVKLSSLPGSPMILVFWGPNFSPESQWGHPNGGVKCKGVGKSCTLTNRPFRLSVCLSAASVVTCFRSWCLICSQLFCIAVDDFVESQPSCRVQWSYRNIQWTSRSVHSKSRAVSVCVDRWSKYFICRIENEHNQTLT